MIHLGGYLLILISASAPLVSGIIIYPNSTITPVSNAYWNSSSGSFSMGFFSLQPNAYYVGIWYAILPIDQAVIWTAYRNHSVSENSSLQFTGDGYLQLRDSSNSVIWSAATSAGVKVSASEAEMMDTGNFVLRNGSASLLWESFNLPTDTLLPDQNFTASSPVLVSWSTSTNPTPTDRYRLVLEISGNIRLLYQSALEYWSENSADSSNIYRTFRLNSNGSIGLYNDADELSWYNFSCPSNNSFTKVRLDADGNLRVLAWSAISNKWNILWRALYLQCDVFGACGDNGVCDYDLNVLGVGGTGCPLTEPSIDTICFCPSGFTRVNGNCVAESAINCSQYTTTLDNTMFGVPNQNATDHHLSLQDCRNNCLNDCTCKAACYSNSTLDCWLQTNDLFNGRRDSSYTVTAYIRTVASAPTPATNGSSSSFPVYAIVLIIVFSSVAVLAVLSCAVYLARSRFRGTRAPPYQEIAFPDMTERIGAPRRFSFQDLNLATRGFSEECKIGSGGFGTVFKGTIRLPNRSDANLEVAVKRLVQGNDAAGNEEQSDFLAEVEILASIRHINVVNLLGYCAEGSERLLVYEFVANGSLDRHLFAGHKVLDWNTRVQIAVGAATGIEYLHTHCPKKIVHRDIKPPNILVDEEHRAKVADFGVSQIMGPESTHLTNYAPGGTPTYMAPECWRLGAMVTEKADVYSFGVVLLEIVSGKRVTKQMQQGVDGKQKRVLNLQEALQLMEGERYEGFVDERLGGDYNWEDVERLVKVAFWCLQGDPDRRPSMEDLLLIIKGHKSVHVPPPSGLLHYSSLSRGASRSPTHTVVIPEDISEGR